MATKRQVIGVLGCHRSGTSALTRGMSALSAVIGDDLLPPVEGNNPTGFWEDRELHVLLQTIQREAGSDWDELGYGFVANHRYMQHAAKQQLLEFFDHRASSEYPFVFKNPRATLMLPVLHEVFDELDIASSYVIAVRDPLSTAQSLQRRDNLPAEFGGLLWLKYVTEAVVQTSDSNRVFVRFDNYLQNPEAELRRIELALDVPGLVFRPGEVRQLANEFLQPDLRHHVHTVDELAQHPAISDNAVSAFKSLLEVTESDPDQSVQLSGEFWEQLAEDLASRRSEWLMIDDARRSVKTQSTELSNLRDELAQTEKTNTAALAEVRDAHARDTERLEREADRLTTALQANSQALESSRAILEERVGAIEREAESRIREAESSALAESYELREQVQAQTGQMDELEKLAARLLIERDTARVRAAETQSGLAVADELQQQVDEIKSSTSWRVTKPLRLAGDVAKARRRRR